MTTGALSERLFATMIAADRPGASRIIEEALLDGIAPRQVIAEILDPAIVSLGKMWEEQSMSLAQNFVASKIAEDTPAALHSREEGPATQ